MANYNRNPLADEPAVNPATLTINPQDYYGCYYDDNADLYNVRIPQTYMHGELQEKAGYDIFAFVGECPKAVGVYPVKVLKFDVDATLYLWKDNSQQVHGLVVENSDTESVQYAVKCYNDRVSCL